MKQNKFKQTTIGKIPENWQVIEFGKLLKENTRNGIYKPKEFHGTGIKIVNMKELFAYEWIGSQAMTMIDLTENEKKNFLLNPGDLIFARRSLVASGAGKCSLIVEHSEPLTFESSIIRARPDEKLSNPLFLYYLFRSSYGKYIVGTILRQVAVSGITGSDLVKLPLPIPPLSEQKDIANELFTIDAKIELNHQMNQTLEAIGQALFKHWFVDFEFSDEEGKPYKSSGGEMVFNEELGKEIPKGWEVGRIKDIASKEKNAIVDGPFGTQMKIAEYQEDGIPIVEMEYLEGFPFYRSFKHFISKEKYEEVKRSTVKEGDIIISKTGTLGLLGIMTDIYEKGVIVSRLAKITIDENKIGRYYLFLILKQLSEKKFWEQMSSGSTMPIINLTHIKSKEILIPKTVVRINFEKIMETFYDTILNNLKQSQNLSQIRDLLLPKLMSGKIRVPVEGE